MGTKRSFKEADASTPDRGADPGGPRSKKPKFKQQTTKEETAKEENVSRIKKRVRDIERIFKRNPSDLPANVQKDLERELAAHKSRITEEKDRRERSRMIGKYHMVRFFERKKAMRLSKQLNRQLKNATDPAEIEAVNADLHIAEVDINYAKYFPFMEPYVSLYKATTTEKPDDKSSAQLALHSDRPPLWATVEEAMEEGHEALERLRDRRPDVDSDAKLPPPPPSKPAKRGKTKPKEREEKQAGPAKDSRENSGPKNTNEGKAWVNPYKLKARSKVRQEEASDGDDGGFFEEG